MLIKVYSLFLCLLRGYQPQFHKFAQTHENETHEIETTTQ